MLNCIIYHQLKEKMNLSDDEMTERINLLTVSCYLKKEKDLKFAKTFFCSPMCVLKCRKKEMIWTILLIRVKYKRLSKINFQADLVSLKLLPSWFDCSNLIWHNQLLRCAQVYVPFAYWEIDNDLYNGATVNWKQVG